MKIVYVQNTHELYLVYQAVSILPAEISANSKKPRLHVLKRYSVNIVHCPASLKKFSKFLYCNPYVVSINAWALLIVVGTFCNLCSFVKFLYCNPYVVSINAWALLIVVGTFCNLCSFVKLCSSKVILSLIAMLAMGLSSSYVQITALKQ